MWTVWGVMLATVALVPPAWSGDIYRWSDSSGNVHYSNIDGVDGGTKIEPAERARADDDDGDAEASTAPDTGAFSAQASLRRNALERDLRATDRRLRELDGRLASLARARGQNAAGSAATGGVGTGALDVRSDEEKTLATEREQLAQHATEVRADAARLRDEVTTRLGTTPAWWIDVR